MKYHFIVLFGLILFSCNEKQTKAINADDIINKSIVASGVDKLDNSNIVFDFRGMGYPASRANGKFELQRVFTDSRGKVHDQLNNKGFERYVNDSLVAVSDSLSALYSASVNSVHYFAVLPYSLDGKAVNRTYLGTVDIKDKSYYKIKVTFNKDGGGEDFEDEFIYWIHTETAKIDYLAYSYMEDDGLGLRFREAYNERFVNGVRFVDYNNYKPKEASVMLENLDTLFVENQLELLSKIELKNVTVN